MSTDQGLNGVTISFNGTQITNLESFSGMGFEAEKYEVTYIGDTWQRSNPTVFKIGDLNLVLGYDPASHEALEAALAARTVATVAVALAAQGSLSSSSLSCSGYVSKYELAGGDSKQQAKLNVSFSFTGTPTVA